MEKLIKDGFVAVVISPGYGAGWSTWNDHHREELIFHPVIVQKVLDDKTKELTSDFLCDLLGVDKKEQSFYTGGSSQLRIKWVRPGNVFTIEEYDGFETLIEGDSFDYYTA